MYLAKADEVAKNKKLIIFFKNKRAMAGESRVKFRLLKKKTRKGKLFESGTKPVASMAEFCLIINKKRQNGVERIIATLTAPTNCPVSDRYIHIYISIYKLAIGCTLQKIVVKKLLKI